jgi:hypothetical protein
MRARVTVPLLGYFVVVTPALLGLLFAAEAAIGPLEPIKLSTPAPEVLIKRHQRKADSIQILTVREQVPVPASELAAVASLPEAKPTAISAQTKVQATERKKKPAKVARAPSANPGYNGYNPGYNRGYNPSYYRGQFARTSSHSAVY